MENKKVVLVGDAGVGKTTLVRFALTGEQVQRYIPTMGVDVWPILWNSPQKGTIRFNIWDCAGDPQNGGLHDGCYIQTQIAIVLYKNDEWQTQKDWVAEVRERCPTIPIVRCINHFDGLLPNTPTEADTIHLNLVNGEGVDVLFNHLVNL